MPLQLGLVGLPNVGKSTLFNALTQAGAAVANYPFTTIEPNVGIVPVPDARLAGIAEIVAPDRTVAAALRVVDIAGLVRGASHGEGLGNQFLSHIRTVDAIAMVVRCFEDDQVPHVAERLDPVDDIETIELELILADLAVMERHVERVQGSAKGRPRDFAHEMETCEQVMGHLQAGRLLRMAGLEQGQLDLLRDVALLTLKPCLYIANVGEGDLPDGGDMAAAVRRAARERGTEAIVLCAQLESEIVGWEADEAAEYLDAVGLAAPGLERFAKAGYALLDEITFFTMTGRKEVRAWTLQRGQTVLEAAGAIHTDMARGFIRAEIVSYDDLARLGSLAKARDAGLLRLEGRDYVVADGDVIHIRFAV